MDQAQYLDYRTSILRRITDGVLVSGKMQSILRELVAEIQKNIQADDSIVALDLGEYSHGSMGFTITISFKEDDHTLLKVPVECCLKLEAERKALSVLCKQTGESVDLASQHEKFDYSPLIRMIDAKVFEAVNNFSI